MRLAAGSRLGAYEVVGPLGAGGMGEVYRARDTRLGRDVALKVLPAELVTDPERLARFEHEARVLAGLDHPNIVTLHTLEDVAGTRFLTLELVDGQTLDRVLSPGGLPIAQVLEIGVAIADALTTAHESGIVHRDLKPANVMLSRSGRVKVLDFGLAKLTAPISDSDATQAATRLAFRTTPGVILGTVPYMSPEQITGQRVDSRSDLFSLGVLLYELATGRRPFEGDSPAETISAILRDEPRPLVESRLDAPPRLERIIERCLEKEPGGRFQTANDAREELSLLRRELDSGTGGRTDLAGVSATARTRNTLAVLPFVNRSSDREQEYFSDGLTEEVLNVLARIPELRVTGRTSSWTFKGKQEDLRSIGRKLGVAHILEGSVRRSGERIRVTAQLVKADDGFHVWSETYDRTLDDVFAVQDDIAAQVAAKLRVTLLAQDGARARPAAEAYDLVLRARYALQGRTKENLAPAKALLDEALRTEPGYAPAWTELGLAYTREYELGATLEERRSAGARARGALEKALALEPDLGLAHSRLATILVTSWDFAGAQRAAARGLAAEPHNPIVMGNAALLHSTLGRLDEAIALGARALELDPLSPVRLANLANAYLLTDRPDEAEALARRRLELLPDEPFSHFLLGDVHLVRREPEAARSSYARFRELSGAGDGSRLIFEALVEHSAGNTAASAAAAAEYERLYGDADPRAVAELRAWRGETDAAFAWLDRAVAARDPAIAELNTDLYLRSLRSDPRWNELLRKVGLPAE